MDLKEAIERRHSIREFSNKSISIEIINEILEYANLAPSSGNLQARDFIIVDDDQQKIRLSKASLNQMFISEAPYVIVVCANLNRILPYGKRGIENYCIQDVAASVEHILLLAVDSGLGACWIGAFNDNEVSKIIGCPKYIKPIALIPIGYPKGEIDKTSRKDIKSITHHNRW
jgi:nitroreductase